MASANIESTEFFIYTKLLEDAKNHCIKEALTDSSKVDHFFKENSHKYDVWALEQATSQFNLNNHVFEVNVETYICRNGRALIMATSSTMKCTILELRKKDNEVSTKDITEEVKKLFLQQMQMAPTSTPANTIFDICQIM